MSVRNCLSNSAPFAAPLAYAGLGLLVLLNRMVPAESPEWGWWIVFLALGGFAGNLALSLTDHAQNGFFNALERFQESPETIVALKQPAALAAAAEKIKSGRSS